MVSIEEINKEMNNREEQQAIEVSDIVGDVSEVIDSDVAVGGSEEEDEIQGQQINAEEDEDADLDHDGGFQHPLLNQIKNNSPMVTSVKLHCDDLHLQKTR